MTVDYGLRPRRRRAWLYVALVGATLFVGAAAFAHLELRDWLARRERAIATARAWDIAGPPCPGLTAAQFTAQRLKAPKAFEFEGVVMARRHGHVSCQTLRTKGGRGFSSYPVCQFTGPGALHVTTEKGEYWFDTGDARSATVSTEGGVARCVLASKFRLEGGRLTYS
jgi:hypothetical protein